LKTPARFAGRVRDLTVCLGAAVAWAALAQTPSGPEASQPAASSAAASAGAFAEGVKAFDAGRKEEAFRLWMPLATQGIPQAQFNIAFMYEKGLGVARSDAEAAHWYLAAAERGDVTAQSKIGNLYEAGVGVAKDLDKAAFWYAQAAKGNAKDPEAARQAREHLAGLADHVEPEDVTAFDGGRFVLRRAASGECVIALQGMVTQSTSYKFDDVVKKAKAQGCVRPLTLMLESPGGLVDAGLALGRSVHEEGMRTVARYACASSCANIFMGGSERILWGSRAAIGLHQPSQHRDVNKPENTICFTTNFDVPVVAMRRYIQFVLPRTSDQIMAVAMSTPCKSITWVNGQGAIDLGLATRIEAEGEDVFGPRAGRVAASGAAPR
jgi:TPR repeat protein